MNFPYPVVILRHWRDLEIQQDKKRDLQKVSMVGNDLGGRPEAVSQKKIRKFQK
jgi:hypothetical protein